jgi:hypothetical protein
MRQGDVRMADADAIRVHRAAIEQALRARSRHNRRAGYGPGLKYGCVLTPDVHGGFRVLTRHSSIGYAWGGLEGFEERGGLTVAMVRELSRLIVYVHGSVAASIDEPAPSADDSALAEELKLLLMVYPHTRGCRAYSSFDSVVRPEDLATEPLVLCLTNRPAGWPR